MTFGIILAAGKQTRFKSEIPKCIWPYDHMKTILEKNIEVMKDYVDKIYVVLNEDADNSLIEDLIPEEHYALYIKSGLGTGHALLQTFNELKKLEDIDINDSCIVIWGDSIQDSKQIYHETFRYYNEIFTLPLKLEDNCYIKFYINSHTKHILNVLKPTSQNESGYHDFSLFLFNISYVYTLLQIYHKKYFAIDKYNTESKEMNFIDLLNEFNYAKFAKAVIIIGIDSVNAFNTVEEYGQIIEKRLRYDTDIR